jgi:hypothetical protein
VLLSCDFLNKSQAQAEELVFLVAVFVHLKHQGVEKYQDFEALA